MKNLGICTFALILILNTQPSYGVDTGIDINGTADPNSVSVDDICKNVMGQNKPAIDPDIPDTVCKNNPSVKFNPNDPAPSTFTAADASQSCHYLPPSPGTCDYSRQQCSNSNGSPSQPQSCADAKSEYLSCHYKMAITNRQVKSWCMARDAGKKTKPILHELWALDTAAAVTCMVAAVADSAAVASLATVDIYAVTAGTACMGIGAAAMGDEVHQDNKAKIEADKYSDSDCDGSTDGSKCISDNDPHKTHKKLKDVAVAAGVLSITAGVSAWAGFAFDKSGLFGFIPGEVLFGAAAAQSVASGGMFAYLADTRHKGEKNADNLVSDADTAIKKLTSNLPKPDPSITSQQGGAFGGSGGSGSAGTPNSTTSTTGGQNGGNGNGTGPTGTGEINMASALEAPGVDSMLLRKNPALQQMAAKILADVKAKHPEGFGSGGGAGSLAEAIGNHLGAQPEMMAAIKTLEDKYKNSASDSTYAAGGITAPTTAAAVASQYNFGGGPAKATSTDLDFNRAPAGDGIDPNDIYHRGFKGSIFDIVSNKYTKSTDRVAQVGFATKMNRALAGENVFTPKKK